MFFGNIVCDNFVHGGFLLNGPMTREEVLAKYMKTLHINQREGLSMVIIAHSAWTRYIDLMAQGRIVYREGLLFRKDELDTAQTQDAYMGMLIERVTG